MKSFICLLTLPVFFAGCRVLFWHDSVAWGGGRWKSETIFYEIQHNFETKSSWYPLNQNALIRDYRTTILVHKIKGTSPIKTFPLIDYKGWTLNNTLYVVGNNLIAIRGHGNSFGKWKREVIAFKGETNIKSGSSDNIQNKPRVLLKPEMRLLAAMPSPDGKLLAVILTQATIQHPTGMIFVDFYSFDIKTLRSISRVNVKWKGAPGLPNLVWAPDSSRLFIHRNSDVVEISPDSKEVTKSMKFPKCFLETTTNVSDSGIGFFREPPDGTIELRKTEKWIPQKLVPFTSDINKIGDGCL